MVISNNYTQGKWQQQEMWGKSGVLLALKNQGMMLDIGLTGKLLFRFMMKGQQKT